MNLENLFSRFLDLHEGARSHDATDFFDTDILDLTNSFTGDTIGITDLLECLSFSLEPDTTDYHRAFFLSERGENRLESILDLGCYCRHIE